MPHSLASARGFQKYLEIAHKVSLMVYSSGALAASSLSDAGLRDLLGRRFLTGRDCEVLRKCWTPA
jgi:hypothetical protein